jgi:hypothetical protein
MIKESYKGHSITTVVTQNKRGMQIVWITVIDGKQIYKVYAKTDNFLDEKGQRELELEALEDCKKQINMSEENVQAVESEEIVTSEATAMEDPAEANVCDSCQ